MAGSTGQPLTPSGSTHRRGGFTLAELVVSLGVMTILLGAMGSALFIATQALPDGNSTLEAVARGGSALDQIASELHTAVGVSSATSTAIEFSVPDRDGGGTPETIRYAWSGTPGDALTRQYNGGDASDFVPNVHDFELAYRFVTTSEERTVDTESSEGLLSHHYAEWNLYDVTVMPGQEPGQFFHPTFPEEATAWSVTRFKIMASQSGSIFDGVASVLLLQAGADGKPSGGVLQEFTMLEKDLEQNPTWREFSVTNASGLSPDAGLILWVRYDGGSGYACEIRHQSGVDPREDSFGVGTFDGGSSWHIFPNDWMLYYVWGTVTAPSKQVVDINFLAAANIALQPHAQACSRIETEVNVLNEPEVPG
jgi:type II secretory pathway pseudopilin PulG